MGGEFFSAQGLIVEALNYLEVYTYDKWTDKALPNFVARERFQPNQLTLHEGRTEPPRLLTEADLITKMDTNGIGTDATIHEHIKTVQERGYACKQGEFIVPLEVGFSLVKTYQAIAIDLHKPYLRAAMEKDMKLIAEGRKRVDEARTECL